VRLHIVRILSAKVGLDLKEKSFVAQMGQIQRSDFQIPHLSISWWTHVMEVIERIDFRVAAVLPNEALEVSLDSAKRHVTSDYCAKLRWEGLAKSEAIFSIAYGND
jgi:hypothetical protein